MGEARAGWRSFIGTSGGGWETLAYMHVLKWLVWRVVLLLL